MVSAAEKEAAALPSAFSTRTFLIWFARAPPGFCEFHTQGPTRLGRAFAAPRELWGNRTGSMAREAADDSADPVSSRSGKRRDGREKAETGSVRRLRAKVPATGAPPQRAPSGGRRHAISARQGATPRGGRTRGRPRGRGYSEGERSLSLPGRSADRRLRTNGKGGRRRVVTLRPIKIIANFSGHHAVNEYSIKSGKKKEKENCQACG